MHPLSRIAVLAAFLAASLCRAEENSTTTPSPDGEFTFEFVDAAAENSYGSARIVRKESGDVVWAAPEEAQCSFLQSLRCLWSPDSKKFAINFRAGGRYETTLAYRWDGKTFVALPSLEDPLSARLDEAKEKQLRAIVEKLPPSLPKREAIKTGSYQRRIWDNFTVRRWVDDNTIETTAYSLRRLNVGNSEDEDEEINGSLRFVLRLDPHNKWKILKEVTIPLEEAQGQDP